MTDWRAKGAIAIEQLTDDYLSGTGKVVTQVTDEKTEAPGLFKRKGIYYVTYSDPNCGYCSGTGTSYKTAPNPLGPWSVGKKISDNSCGGQPSFVATFKLPQDTVLLYGSDLWNNAAKNEALANFYWTPLAFEPDGTIKPLDCASSFQLSKKKSPTLSKDAEVYKAVCEITNQKPFQLSFKASGSGKLESFEIVTLKSGYPDTNLLLEFYEAGRSDKALTTLEIPKESIGWSAKNFAVQPNITVRKGKEYLVILRTESKTGCFGYAKDVASKEGKQNARFSYVVK